MKKSPIAMLALIVLVLVLSSCIQDLHPPVAQKAVIAFSARVVGNPDSSWEWEEGDEIGLYMVSTGESVEPGNILNGVVNYPYTYDSLTGKFWGDAFFPADGTEVDLFAYYPYQDTPELNEGSAYIYKVDVRNQANPYEDDLIFARVEGVGRDVPVDVDLTFQHKLSKLTLEISAGAGLETGDLAGLSVRYYSMPTTADINFENGSISNEQTDAAGGKVPVNAAGTAGVAIIVPHDGGTYPDRTMVFTLLDGRTYTWNIPDAKGFEAGYHSTYSVKLTGWGIEVNPVGVTTWTKGGSSSFGSDYTGIGTVDDPYMIYTAHGLMHLLETYGSTSGIYYELVHDIELGEYLATNDLTWPNVVFNGFFDGKSHVVNGLRITSSAANVGFFGMITDTATVNNLGLTNVVVRGTNTGGSYIVGGLAGVNMGMIEDCFVSGHVEGDGTAYAGGLVGMNGGVIRNSTGYAMVKGNMAGGLAAINDTDEGAGEITDSKVIAESIHGVRFAGGFVADNSGVITDSHAIVRNVNSSIADGYAGGFVGRNYNRDITDSYAVSNRVSGAYAGGFAGYIEAGEISFLPESPRVDTIAGTVDGRLYAGGFVGSNKSGSIENVSTVFDRVVTTGYNSSDSHTGSAGGFVGRSFNSGSSIVDSSAKGRGASSLVEGWMNVGGFAGVNDDGASIENCFVEMPEGKVTIAGEVMLVRIGGFVGYLNSATISDSWTDIGEIDAETLVTRSLLSVGGFVGLQEGGDTTSITNSTAVIDTISSTDSTMLFTGGFVGYMHDSGTISHAGSSAIYPTAKVGSITVSGSDSATTTIHTGGFAGYVANSSLITGITVVVTGSIDGGASVGGFAGTISNTDVSDVRVVMNGSVKGGDLVGGFAGQIMNGAHIEEIRIYVEEDIVSTGTGTGSAVGGFAALMSGSQTEIMKSRVEVGGGIHGHANIGGFVGRVPYNSGVPQKIEESAAIVTGSIYKDVGSTGGYAGGFIGEQYNADISQCSVLIEEEIIGNNSNATGGFVGAFNSGNVSNSYVRVRDITGSTSSYVGGFFGLHSSQSGIITNSYVVTGSIVGGSYVGGFGGLLFYDLGNLRSLAAIITEKIEALDTNPHMGVFIGSRTGLPSTNPSLSSRRYASDPASPPPALVWTGNNQGTDFTSSEVTLVQNSDFSNPSFWLNPLNWTADETWSAGIWNFATGDGYPVLKNAPVP
ncbi:fimbrillin family protein [Parasphaerochaeta coccoides]|uniref:GLUG domain-containing protein n=1 Tax=Parasphaerochaeta coccoides (strain ATCC BAA-1237 / DSM 17374 / SPN1) TaxID=760011 RepID=F4GKJ6_PARC1|nr:fimbrillin family protein [Parasphaerochaeta coccoides]AEC02879.1 hypothetical protein Spico_1681 [Parasphaerochaeta coccoides DSM 17374]